MGWMWEIQCNKIPCTTLISIEIQLINSIQLKEMKIKKKEVGEKLKFKFKFSKLVACKNIRICSS